MIDDPQNLNIASIKPKALTLTRGFMFAGSLFQIDDNDGHGQLQVAHGKFCSAMLGLTDFLYQASARPERMAQEHNIS